MFSLSFLTGILAIILAGYFSHLILKRKIVSDKMNEVAEAIKTGANAYLLRQIKTILYLTPLLFFCLYFLLGWQAALTSVLGIVTSLAASFIGMAICVRANLQTADVASESRHQSFLTAVRGGAVMGLCITGFSLIVLSILFQVFKDPNLLIGFGFGASLAALFAQIGGGIFTKSADIGADLVGKVEKQIPEDDPRNAAVITDLVGDNVGDCAGRGADLFQTFSDDIITGSIVALTSLAKFGPKVLFFPILLQTVGVIASEIGIILVQNWKRKSNPSTIFHLGLYLSAFLSLIGSFFLTKYLLNDFSIFVAIFLGVATTLVAEITTKHYAGIDERPVQNIALASKGGPALNLITAMSYGLRSPLGSIIMIVGSILLAYRLSGGLLLAIAAVNIGTDLLIGYIMTSDTFGPIVDNAHGIAEMSKSSKETIRSFPHWIQLAIP